MQAVKCGLPEYATCQCTIVFHEPSGLRGSWYAVEAFWWRPQAILDKNITMITTALRQESEASSDHQTRHRLQGGTTNMALRLSYPGDITPDARQHAARFGDPGCLLIAF